MPIPFKLPRFYPILDTLQLSERGMTAVSAAEALLQAGVRILQYRHKENWTQAHFDDAKRIASLCHEAGVLFVVNDRADFARLLGAALHVGQEDLPPVAARRIISDEVMGFSTHNREQLSRAAQEPVEYVSLGPIFATGSKQRPDPVVGIDGVKELRGLTDKPLVAIGGIDLVNSGDILNAGADSLAVISALLPENSDRKILKRRAEEWIRITVSPSQVTV
ncbi:MAG: thiamine phosphate synthase [Acidobacteriaceae bacterium]|nr:thiamine phosphate synthase [Acidobacteriaceae bacterium]